MTECTSIATGHRILYIAGDSRNPTRFMADNYQTLSLSKPGSDEADGQILTVTLDREAASNAFNTQMAHDLIDVFEGFATAPDQYRVVILTGRGEKAFCAGGDLKERKGMSDDAWQQQHLVFERMVRAVIDCPVPVIGAVNGAAYGGGCELVAALDFVYAAEHAKFAQTETRLGIIPGIGGTQTLARAIGERRAKEYVLSGNAFTATQACQWGLVNQVFPSVSALNDAVIAVATRIAANAPLAVRQARQSIHSGLQMSLNDGMAFEIEAYNKLVPTADRYEGVLAFNEKRKPVFNGT